MAVLDLPQKSLIDRQLVNALASRLGDLLADERLDRRARNMADPSNNEEHDFARTAVHAELLRLSAARRSEGRSVLSIFDETEITSAVIAQVLGLGRLQPLLEDDEISDIHVRGNAPVWVKLRNGLREMREPIVETDDELIELVRRAATRLSRQERRFDSRTKHATSRWLSFVRNNGCLIAPKPCYSSTSFRNFKSQRIANTRFADRRVARFFISCCASSAKHCHRWRHRLWQNNVAQGFNQ